MRGSTQNISISKPEQSKVKHRVTILISLKTFTNIHCCHQRILQERDLCLSLGRLSHLSLSFSNQQAISSNNLPRNQIECQECLHSSQLQLSQQVTSILQSLSRQLSLQSNQLQVAMDSSQHQQSRRIWNRWHIRESSQWRRLPKRMSRQLRGLTWRMRPL